VILDAGLGSTSKDWSKVDPAVVSFSKVYSYERAGWGRAKRLQRQGVARISLATSGYYCFQQTYSLHIFLSPIRGARSMHAGSQINSLMKLLGWY